MMPLDTGKRRRARWVRPTSNRACVEAMLRSAGFEITAHPESEVYLCRCAKRPYDAGAVYPARGTRS